MLQAQLSLRRSGQFWLNLAPPALGGGLLLYHVLPWSWEAWVAWPLLIAAVLLGWLRPVTPWRSQMRWPLMTLLLIPAGLLIASITIPASSNIMLSQTYRAVDISGEVRSLSYREDGRLQLVLDALRGAKLTPGDQGGSVRLAARPGKGGAPLAGERVTLEATIFPPSRPSYPGGFDFARYFFLRDIGGVGYATSPIQRPVGPHQPEQTEAAMFAGQAMLARWRQSLQDYLLETLNQPQSGLAVALTTGDKRAVPEPVRDAMTASGLAHMLAISGMHMAMVCGLVFFGLRYAAACMPRIALYYPVKQMAALGGLISGAVYLGLAGFPISAVRAYVMVAVMFVAVLAGREADTLRSLVLAALLVMLVSPASVVDIGFQLSFTAALGLILFYRRLRPVNQRLREREVVWWQRGLLYIAEAGVSSLVAGLVTAPLMLYHFNQFAPYSFLANMIALPLLSMVVMPGLLLALLLSPLSLDGVLLRLAGQGMEAIAGIAGRVAEQPHALLHIVAPPGIAVVVMLLAIFALLRSRQVRQAVPACVVALVAGSSGYWQVPPDVLVAEDRSAIAVRRDGQRWWLLKGRPDNFHVEQWQQRSGETFTVHQPEMTTQSGWRCDAAGCDGAVNGQAVRVRFDYKTPGPLCRDETRLMIATFYANARECRSVQAVRVDRDRLERLGSHAFWLSDAGIRSWHACQRAQHWPWLRCEGKP